MSKHRIRELNDAFRQTFIGGRVVVTPGVRSLPLATNALLLDRVRTFTEFDADNDPHQEPDFGSLMTHTGHRRSCNSRALFDDLVGDGEHISSGPRRRPYEARETVSALFRASASDLAG